MTLLSDEDVSNLYVFWDATEGASHADLIRATERKVLRLAELADAQAEIARLRAALEAVYELAHDPAILTICREATQ